MREILSDQIDKGKLHSFYQIRYSSAKTCTQAGDQEMTQSFSVNPTSCLLALDLKVLGERLSMPMSVC